MRTIYDAFYLSVFLYFVRKILSKVTTDISEGIPRRSHDSSGCWNVVCRGVSVFYSYSKATAFELARQIREEVPGLQGPNDIEVVEDECIPSQAVEEVPGLNPYDCTELGLVVNIYED